MGQCFLSYLYEITAFSQRKIAENTALGAVVGKLFPGRHLKPVLLNYLARMLSWEETPNNTMISTYLILLSIASI